MNVRDVGAAVEASEHLLLTVCFTYTWVVYVRADLSKWLALSESFLASGCLAMCVWAEGVEGKGVGCVLLINS